MLARELDEATEAKQVERAEGGCDKIYQHLETQVRADTIHQTRPVRRKAEPNPREQRKAKLRTKKTYPRA